MKLVQHSGVQCGPPVVQPALLVPLPSSVLPGTQLNVLCCHPGVPVAESASRSPEPASDKRGVMALLLGQLSCHFKAELKKLLVSGVYFTLQLEVKDTSDHHRPADASSVPLLLLSNTCPAPQVFTSVEITYRGTLMSSFPRRCQQYNQVLPKPSSNTFINQEKNCRVSVQTLSSGSGGKMGIGTLFTAKIIIYERKYLQTY